MMLLIESLAVPAGAAFLIGIATGWWAFRHRRRADDDMHAKGE